MANEFSAIVPFVDEVTALHETVNVLIRQAGSAITEIVLVAAPHVTPDSMSTAAALALENPTRVRIVNQCGRGLGDAFLVGIRVAHGSHVVLMFSDLESDPAMARRMIEIARLHPKAIISASRWLPGSKFHGYSRLKLVANYMAQLITRWLFGTKLTDFTFGYRVWPRDFFELVRCREPGHGFVYESLLKALRLGYDVYELPAVWRARREGTASGGWRAYKSYARILVVTRFAPTRYFRRKI